MKNETPNVTIVIPTFNRSKYVQKAIESALVQTYPCEIIVCDHGSRDNTPNIIKKYGNRIKYIRKKKDFGPHFCWLDGILHANAKFIHLQFDDDWISKNYIEECMKFMKKDVGVVISDVVTIDDFGNQKKGVFHFKKIFNKNGIFKKKILEKELLRGRMYSPGASLFRKQDLIDALYMGNLPLFKHKEYHGVGPDLFFTLLAILRYKKIGIITDPLVFFREHKNSITIDAHKNIKKYLQIKNAYSNVLEYYMFLKWFWLFDKFKYFSLRFWIRKITHLIKLALKKIGLFDFVAKVFRKINLA